MALDKFNVIEFVVTGRNPFPLDMLRYDSCVPADSESASVIAISIAYGLELKDPARSVKLRRFYPVGGERWPTVGRWASFGWTVVNPTLL